MFNASINLSILNVLAFGGTITPTSQSTLSLPSGSRFVSFHPYDPSTNSTTSNFPFPYLLFTPSVNLSGGFITNSNNLSSPNTISPVSINYYSFWYGDNNSKTLISYSLLHKPLELTSGDSITIESNELVITFA